MARQAGDLRERVTIQTDTTVKDAGGGDVETWADLATVHAEVMPVQGRETEDAGRLAGLQTYLITIRHRTDFGVDDRLSWRGTILNISKIENRDMHRRYLQIEAVEGTQNA